MINIRTFIIILGLIVSTCFVVIKLTQQRVQLEGLNSLNNISQGITPFKWDFVNYENDLVESSKPIWHYNIENHSITAKADTQAFLSLNFSSEVINSQLFDKLIIRFKHKPSTKLLIQFKTELDDDYFYYSPHINITNKTMAIDLSALQWLGKSDSHPKKREIWGTETHKVSSLVFNFTKSLKPIVIDSIELPFNSNNMQISTSHVDCNGVVNPPLKLNVPGIKHLVLTETCLLPSNYMWLKRALHQLYPGSVLTLDGVKTMEKSKLHRVNQSYKSLFYINLIFYSWLILILLVIKAMTKHSPALIKSKTLITAKFNFKFSYKAYAYVLIPSFIIFILLNYFKSADLITFKSLPYYFVWALFQQFLLVYVLAEKIFYKKGENKLLASLLAALVFSSLHLPSVSLFILTFLAATFWSYAWLKHKKIIPLALSHSVLALMLYYVAPDAILYSAKVFQWFWE